jgi:hypothetical protein
MNDSRSQSGSRHERPGPTSRTAAGAALLAALVVLAVGAAVAGEPPAANLDGADTLGVDSPIGRIDYYPGRGLRLGDTRITLGGFTKAEAELLEGGDNRGGLEGANFFLFFDPLPFVHAFSELETGTLVGAQTGQEGVRTRLALGVERAYGDFGASNAATLRFGKFLTPVGRWNTILAEPLTWTTSTPLIVEDVFDESTTGAMLWGSVFPKGGALSYSLYGAFLDPLDPDPDAPPAKHTAGAYLDWTSLDGWAVGASYFASQSPTGGWHQLGGVDGLWRPNARVELSGESVFGEGSREGGALWGLYAQVVVETIDTLYAVGRYERFDPPDDGRSVDLFDVGLTWVPVYYLRLKADYSFVDHSDVFTAPGFRASFSILF